jgi:hypothetical protein
MSSGRHEQAQELSSSLIDLSLQGLHYFQTYDWPFLLSVVSLGYVGWIAFLVLHVVAHNTNLPAYVRHRLAQSNRNVPLPSLIAVHFACGGSLGRPGRHRPICWRPWSARPCSYSCGSSRPRSNTTSTRSSLVR